MLASKVEMKIKVVGITEMTALLSWASYSRDVI